MKFKSFDQSAKEWIATNIKYLTEKSMHTKDMLYFLASQLHQQKIEIPNYYALAITILRIYNQIERKFTSKIR